MATAARRARMGSTKAIARALREAGVPLVTLSPGEFAVDETHLARFLQKRETEPAPPPKPRPKPTEPVDPTLATTKKTAARKRRQ
jgi:hypothetical protein